MFCHVFPNDDFCIQIIKCKYNVFWHFNGRERRKSELQKLGLPKKTAKLAIVKPDSPVPVTINQVFYITLSSIGTVWERQG